MIRKAIFIDGSFLFHHTNSLQIRINYKKLKEFLINDDEHLVSCCYYTALPTEYDMDKKHKNFVQVLKRDIRMRVRSVPLLKLNNADGSSPRYSKGEDILLACDVMRGAVQNQYDTAVLITGDGDFVPLVQQIQDFGKRVIIAGFKDSLSMSLEMEANDVILLDNHIQELSLNQGGGDDQ